MRFWYWGWRGYAMGCAELVPGISGMTVALLTGVYPSILQAIALVSQRRWWQTFLRRPIDALREMQFVSLAVLLLGMVLAFASLTLLIDWLWNNQRALVQAFFCGLILLSGIGLLRKGLHGFSALLCLACGIGVALAVGSVSASELWPQGWLGLVLGGSLAAIAWVLPGLSGNLLLLLIGLYGPVLGMLASLDFAGLAPFVLGGVLSVVSLGRLVLALWRRWPERTRLTMAGMVLGSLFVLLPEQYSLASLPVALAGAGLGWILVRSG